MEYFYKLKDGVKFPRTKYWKIMVYSDGLIADEPITPNFVSVLLLSSSGY